MSKLTYAALSLIGAIPGGFLSYRLVAAMLSHFRDMVGMMKLVVCLILLLGAIVTVMPLGILVFVKEEKPEQAKDEQDETAADVAEDVEAAEAPASDDDAEVESLEPEETATAVEDDGDFFEDFVEAEEEPEPKGKKKKKK